MHADDIIIINDGELYYKHMVEGTDNHYTKDGHNQIG